MKKLLLQTIFLLSLFLGNNIMAQSSSITVFSQNLCMNSKAYAVVSSTVPSATNYSWTISSGSVVATQTPATNGLTTFITYPSTCGIYTISCSAYNGTVFLTSMSTTVSVACNFATVPTITASLPNGTVCAGNGFTLNAGGNTTYTWIPGNISGASAVFSPTSSNCYTVLANNASGCFNMSASYCMSVVPTYSMAVSGNTNICVGNSTTLSLSGGPSFVTNPGNINSANPVLTPSVTSMYTIACPSFSYACPSLSVLPIIVNPLPTISVVSSSGSSTLCSGASKTLIASGGSGSNTYTWNTGVTAPSTVVSPTASTCYSVAGSNTIGCYNMAVYCLSVLATPNLSLAGNSTVCLGSSTTLTVSGANSYTWAANSSTTTTAYFLPTNTTPISANVYGTGSNGCNGYATYTVNALNSCAIVWPGDANRDGMVSNTDVLELGLAASSTGAARSSASNAWTGQYANAWTGTVSTGWNLAHADCNGDGVINSSDNAAINSNFSFTHAFKHSETSVVPDIKIVASPNIAYEGIWNKVDIVLGDVSNNINQLYGVAFDINYDQSMVQTDSVKINYTASFLNATNQNITFQKPIHVNGKVYAASVRVDHNNVNGNGIIGEFWFKVKSGLPNNSTINISTTNAQKVSTIGLFNNLSTDAAVVLNISNNLTGIMESLKLTEVVKFYPNPSSQKITLQSDLSGVILYSLTDITGREIIKGEFVNSKNLDLSKFENGTYILRFESGQNQINKKLIIEH